MSLEVGQVRATQFRRIHKGLLPWSVKGGRWRSSGISAPSAAQLDIIGRRLAPPPRAARTGAGSSQGAWWRVAVGLSRDEILARYGFSEQRLDRIRQVQQEKRRRGARHSLSDSEGVSSE